MKAVVVHQSAARVELDWSDQFAGRDPVVKAQFAAVNWGVRVPQVFKIAGFKWDDVVKAVSDAAVAAGSGGVVIVASGHGGSVPNNDDGGLINWDPTDADVDMDWTKEKIRKGLFWDDMVARYLDPIPFGKPPNQKGIDEENIKNKVKGFELIQKRHEAFEALDKMGQALRANGVARLTFTVCTAGRAPNFMNRLAKICGVEVACFNQKTMVLDDSTFGHRPGKSRLVLEADAKVDNQGTNILSARVFSPSLDNSSIAFVGTP